MPVLLAALVVTVHLFDAYGVSPHDLNVAMSVASSTLSRAGVETRWIACTKGDTSPGCQTVLPPGDVILRIRPGATNGLAPMALGSALVNRELRTGVIATLYADRVADVSHRSGTAAGTLLGWAAAHELGHLLLGSTSHPRRGLMRALWTSRELQRGWESDWMFTAGEVNQIHARATERARARAENGTRRAGPIPG